ncbi:MAG: hypothetical protein P4M09_30535 [Devosia sp.]|nr:hypothetical protein [Devosia sp.]
MAYSLFGERPVIAAWPLAVFGVLARLVARKLKARRNRIALTALLEFDEHRLWDLGISRADLGKALRSDAFDIEAVRDRRRSLDVWPPA